MYKFMKYSAICCALVTAVFTFHFGLVIYLQISEGKPIHDPITLARLAFIMGLLNMVLFFCYLRHIKIINAARGFIEKYTNQDGSLPSQTVKE